MPPATSTLAQRRLHRLRQLIQEQFGGNQTAFSRAVGKAPAQIGQYVREERGIGERVARHIEGVFCLPDGWMDQSDPEGEPATDREPLPPRVETHLRVLDHALREGRVTAEQLESAMHLLGLTEPPTT